MSEQKHAARLGGVGKTFEAKGGATVALTGIDLDVAAGEFVSLIGPSGCGKSTLLRIVADLIQPSEGTVEVNGKSAHQARLDRDYGMVFQTPALFDWRTVEANVKLPLEVMGRLDGDSRARIDQMLELVELGGFKGHYPHQLSGGMQQRVSIARALTFEPSILLMDEPFGALDEMTRERLNTEVLRIWSQTDTTMLFVTHSIPEAVFLSTRVVVMSPRPGRINEIIDIDLPQPRDDATRESERYYELVTRVRESLRGRTGRTSTEGEMEPGADVSSRTRADGFVRMTVANPSADRPRRSSSFTDMLRGFASMWGPPFIVFAVAILFWEWYTAGEGRRLIPPPSRIAQAIIDEQNLLWQVATATIFEALGGLLIGTVAGVLVAFAIARWVVLRDVLLPVAIGMSAIPLVAAAPILINWFGVLNPVSMMMMAALLVFFPIMINVTRGLVEVQPASLELMRSYAAAPGQVLRKVRIPNMLPFFFTALKVASTLAFIGAIVGEYFGGNSRVLGKIVLASLNRGQNDLAWAAIFIGATAAIVTYVAVVLLERLVIPWHDIFRQDES